jgi:hypothetical protein
VRGQAHFSRGSTVSARFLATSNKNSGYSRCPKIKHLIPKHYVEIQKSTRFLPAEKLM